MSGLLRLAGSEKPIKANFGKKKVSLLTGFSISASIKVKDWDEDQPHRATMLEWGEPNFSRFAFDILALLEGTCEPGRISSFHGFGTG